MALKHVRRCLISLKIRNANASHAELSLLTPCWGGKPGGSRYVCARRSWACAVAPAGTASRAAATPGPPWPGKSLLGICPKAPVTAVWTRDHVSVGASRAVAGSPSGTLSLCGPLRGPSAPGGTQQCGDTAWAWVMLSKVASLSSGKTPPVKSSLGPAGPGLSPWGWVLPERRPRGPSRGGGRGGPHPSHGGARLSVARPPGARAAGDPCAPRHVTHATLHGPPRSARARAPVSLRLPAWKLEPARHACTHSHRRGAGR